MKPQQFFVVTLLGILLFANIASSQLISPLYFRLVDNEKENIVEFLTRIKSLPEFPGKLLLFKNLYGRRIEDAVFEKEERREKMIQNLEQILKENPKAKEVLYSLFLLHRDAGEREKAKMYLERAKAVDPEIRE
ncbi:hypothetical protein HYT33_01775 [Candidatus Roizmanbacteria bacterium]|nr:hypothetical protein [Candidatus Roizmanbacteria bacterium]